jgi:hypothetical protein
MSTGTWAVLPSTNVRNDPVPLASVTFPPTSASNRKSVPPPSRFETDTPPRTADRNGLNWFWNRVYPRVPAVLPCPLETVTLAPTFRSDKVV